MISACRPFADSATPNRFAKAGKGLARAEDAAPSDPVPIAAVFHLQCGGRGEMPEGVKPTPPGRAMIAAASLGVIPGALVTDERETGRRLVPQRFAAGGQPGVTAAVETGAPVDFVYILDDDSPGPWKIGGASRWWLDKSLAALAPTSNRAAPALTLRRGDAAEELPCIVSRNQGRKYLF